MALKVPERYFRFRGFGDFPNKSQAGAGICRCPACERWIGYHRYPACEFVKDPKYVVEGVTIAMKNKVIVKDRDEWSSLANFIGNIIAKYADEIDFDSLPDPDVYLQKRYVYESYKAYMKFRNKKMKWNIEGN